MGQLSISEIEILRQISEGKNTKSLIYSNSKMSTTTIHSGVNRLLTLKLLTFISNHNKRTKPVELTDKGKLALRWLGELEKFV